MLLREISMPIFEGRKSPGGMKERPGLPMRQNVFPARQAWQYASNCSADFVARGF
jgi:hypothetical protein